MLTKKQYVQNFRKRYHLNGSFFESFLYLIGVADNPYKKCMDKILNRKPHEALAEDVLQVSNDFKNAFERYKREYASTNQSQQEK